MLGNVETLPKKHSKRKRAPSVQLNWDGCPQIPKVTEKDKAIYTTKAIQGMLREYMKAHIRTCISDYCRIHLIQVH